MKLHGFFRALLMISCFIYLQKMNNMLLLLKMLILTTSLTTQNAIASQHFHQVGIFHFHDFGGKFKKSFFNPVCRQLFKTVFKKTQLNFQILEVSFESVKSHMSYFMNKPKAFFHPKAFFGGMYKKTFWNHSSLSLY